MGSNVYANATVRINYQQSTPATTWTIAHGIGTSAPLVDVYVDINGTYTQILPEHVYATDENTVELVFSTAYAGYATVM